MSVGSTELIPGVGSTEPGRSAAVGLADGDTERFLLSLRRNLVHYYDMARFALPALKQAKGAIVNVGSKVAETGQGGTSAYAAANGGRNALTPIWDFTQSSTTASSAGSRAWGARTPGQGSGRHGEPMIQSALLKQRSTTGNGSGRVLSLIQ